MRHRVKCLFGYGQPASISESDLAKQVVVALKAASTPYEGRGVGVAGSRSAQQRTDIAMHGMIISMSPPRRIDSHVRFKVNILREDL